MSSTLELDSGTVAKLQDLAMAQKLSVEDLLKACVPGLVEPLSPPLTPEQARRGFDEWIAELPDIEGPPLSDEAISRESIYEGR